MRISYWSSDVCSSDLIDRKSVLTEIIAADDEVDPVQRTGELQLFRNLVLVHLGFDRQDRIGSPIVIIDVIGLQVAVTQDVLHRKGIAQLERRGIVDAPDGRVVKPDQAAFGLVRAKRLRPRQNPLETANGRAKD